MKVFYSSYSRFCATIIKRWDKTGVKYNQGNIQILKYAWIASVYWANRNGNKVSEVNKVETKNLRIW